MAKTETVAVPAAAGPRKYTEDMVITIGPKGATNPKRAASALRFALYRDGLTVREYLDGCLALHPDEPRYRWRADLAWDEKREFIVVGAAPKAE